MTETSGTTEAPPAAIGGEGEIPYFDRTEGEPIAPRGRVLLVTYAYPPDVNVGALRWQKMTRHFAERGWGVDVITLDPSDVETRDAARLRDLPQGVRAFGVPRRVLLRQRMVSALGVAFARRRLAAVAVESGASRQTPSAGTRAPGLARRLLRTERVRLEQRSLLLWARDAAALGERIFRQGVHRVVITSGPPHMVHEAGRILARRTGMIHVMDLRDPWSLRSFDEQGQGDGVSAEWLRIAERHETTIVHEASLVVANTEPFAAAMRQRYPSAAARIIAVTNGYDEEPWPEPHERDRFSLRFAGSIYDPAAPALLMRALGDVVRELGLRPGDVSLDMLVDEPHFSGTPLDVVAEQEGVGDFVTVAPFRPRVEALAFLAGASMLVSFPQYSPLAIPAKLFEYVRFHAWLLVMARAGSATDLLLRGCGADVVEPADVAGMARAIATRYREHCAGARPAPLAERGPFSRREQATRLLDAIDRAMAPGASG